MGSDIYSVCNSELPLRYEMCDEPSLVVRPRSKARDRVKVMTRHQKACYSNLGGRRQEVSGV